MPLRNHPEITPRCTEPVQHPAAIKQLLCGGAVLASALPNVGTVPKGKRLLFAHLFHVIPPSNIALNRKRVFDRFARLLQLLAAGLPINLQQRVDDRERLALCVQELFGS